MNLVINQMKMFFKHKTQIKVDHKHKNIEIV